MLRMTIVILALGANVLAPLIGIAGLAAIGVCGKQGFGPSFHWVHCQYPHSQVHHLESAGCVSHLEDGAAWRLRGPVVVVSGRPPVSLGTTISIAPLEEQLSAGTTNLFKGVQYGLRRGTRFLRWLVSRWATWAMRASGFLLIVLLAPLLGRGLVASWEENGWRGMQTWILLGLAVHVRLLLDRQAPLVGKMAVALAIVYGVAACDLVPDGVFPVGLVDDLLVIVLASRGFILMCPNWMVTEHALRAARPRERL